MRAWLQVNTCHNMRMCSCLEVLGNFATTKLLWLKDATVDPPLHDLVPVVLVGVARFLVMSTNVTEAQPEF